MWGFIFYFLDRVHAALAGLKLALWARLALNSYSCKGLRL